MTTTIVIGLLAVVALIGLELLWDWRRSGRLFCKPQPRHYRDRDSQEDEWQQLFGHQKRAAIDAVLTSFCEAFSFNPDSRYFFGPDDQVIEIYRACYPRWKLWLVADCMEIERLMIDLKKKLGVESEVWRPDISLAELVVLADRSNCAAE